MKRAWRLICTAVLLVALLCCCGNVTTVGKTFRYDVPYSVASLDPQFVTDATARMIIGNIFEGLVVQNPNGEIAPGAARSHEVSADGLAYTFHLREGLQWSGGQALTSADFLFAFQRLFSAQSPSPYASDYLSIQNAGEVLSDRRAVADLGISAPDDSTILFTLSHPDPLFLESLTYPPAMPCNEQFFIDSRGRYGLEKKLLLANGPFSLKEWDNAARIVIEQNAKYQSDTATVANSVYFYIGREKPVDLFLDGRSDVLIAPYAQLEALTAKKATLKEFEKTTWCIVFNQSDRALGNALIRQGLCLALDRSTFAEQLSDNFTPTSLLMPPAMMLQGKSYRELAGNADPMAMDPGRGSYLFSLGLEALELDALPSVTFLVPENDHTLYMGLAQQSWQKYLGAYINIQPATPQQIEQQLGQQKYQMLLMPFASSSPRVSSLLNVFTSSSSQNYFGYDSVFYDSIVLDATDEFTVGAAAQKYLQAENHLLADAVVIPVYFETTYYTLAEGVTGVDISPYGSKMNFKYAEKP